MFNDPFAVKSSRYVVEDSAWGRHTIFITDSDDDEPNKSPLNTPELYSKMSLAKAKRSTLLSQRMSVYNMSLPSLENNSETHEDCSLLKFEAVMFATVLEDTLTQIKILDSCNINIRKQLYINDMERLLNIKFGVEQADVERDELDGVSQDDIGNEKYKIIKLQKDRDCFWKLVRGLYSELALSQSFCRFRNELCALIAEKELIDLVFEEEANNRQRRRELSRQLRQQRVLNQSQSNEADDTIDDLLTSVEDVALNGDIRARYVRGWQNARYEQHTQLMRDAESVPGDNIQLYKQSAEDEQRVHTELEAIIAVDIDDILQKIDEWMNTYDIDMEKIDLDIQFKKNDYQDKLDRRIWLEKTIEEHEAAMLAWTTFKEERERERQYRERMHASARSVQSWWRGLLVRKQLGPFKPPKKSKKKK